MVDRPPVHQICPPNRNQRSKVNINGRVIDDLTPADRCVIRRWYRTLRITRYTSQAETGPNQPALLIAYGKDRPDAKQYLAGIAERIAWYTYLGGPK